MRDDKVSSIWLLKSLRLSSRQPYRIGSACEWRFYIGDRGLSKWRHVLLSLPTFYRVFDYYYISGNSKSDRQSAFVHCARTGHKGHAGDRSWGVKVWDTLVILQNVCFHCFSSSRITISHQICNIYAVSSAVIFTSCLSSERVSFPL